ncbi:hypothetical protein Tco_0466214 [Tanacetum coccineum]
MSAIGAAKVSHFEILCRVHGFEPTVGLFHCFYINSKNKGWMSDVSTVNVRGMMSCVNTKPLDSLKSWNDRFFWVDAFACLASFPWNTSKSASKDPFPKSSQYNVEHYATLVAYPAPFHKYPEPFLCLIGISRNYTLDEDTYPQFLRDNNEEMDLLSFIQTVDPTKVRISERQRAEGEPKLLDTTVGHVVPLLPVAPAHASSELEASVDKLFDEGGSSGHAEQGDSISGGHGVGVPQVSEIAEIVAEDAAPVQPRCQRKRKKIVSDADAPSHPPKKLREDHRTLTGPSVAGKSMSVLQILLAGAMLNPEVGVVALPTLPFITSSVSVTPEQEDGDQTDFMAGANLRAINAPPRFVISLDSSHHSGANIAEAEIDSFSRPSVPLMTMTTTVTSTVDPTTTAKEKFVESSIFGGGSSSGLSIHDTNGSCLDDGRTCRDMVDEFAPPKFFASIRGMEHDELFTEFNVGAARQISLSAEVRMRVEFNIREKRRLSVVVEEKDSLLKARDEEVASLKSRLLVKEAEAIEAIYLCAVVQALADRNAVLEGEKSELDVKVVDLAATVKVREQEVADLDDVVTSVKVHNDNLSDQVHMLEVSSAGLQEKVTAYENFIGQLEKFRDDRMREINENFDKLDTDLIELALHLEERFYPHLLTTISGRRWLLTHGLELAIAKCLNLTKYLSSLGASIGKAIEKGMQEGLSARITHVATSRVLTNVAAYNPSVEADYLSALQRLQSVNFSLIIELISNKDASIDTIMNLLRLEDSLAKRLVLEFRGLEKTLPTIGQYSRKASSEIGLPGSCGTGSFPKGIPHDGHGLAKGSLFVNAHGSPSGLPLSYGGVFWKPSVRVDASGP